MMQDSDNIFVFFKPSAELTKEIIKQNQALVKDYTARTAPEEQTETDYYEPHLGRFGLGHLRPMRQTLTSPVEVGQQVIAERMYNYLSSLSESPWAMDGGSFPVSEYLPSGMITMLGFSSLRKQANSARAKNVWRLVELLTEEFVDWLANEQNGAVVTPWLEMHLTTEGELLLIAIPENEVDDSTEEKADEATAAHTYGVPVSYERVATAASIAEMKREMMNAFASAFEAGKRAYRDAHMRNQSAGEEKAVTAGEDYSESKSEQDKPFATASARAEDNRA